LVAIAGGLAQFAAGDPLAACLYAGTSVNGIDDIVPAFELVRRLGGKT
jgi:hypothetical protein